MDDMYNNQNGYQEQQYQYQETSGMEAPRPTVQEQLQYQYQQPQNELEEPMTMGGRMITLRSMWMPCANIIMAFVWALSSKEKKSKSNYFKAYLIFMAIGIVLSIIFFVIMGVSMASIVNEAALY